MVPRAACCQLQNASILALSIDDDKIDVVMMGTYRVYRELIHVSPVAPDKTDVFRCRIRRFSNQKLSVSDF